MCVEHELDTERERFLVSRYVHQAECWDALLAKLDASGPGVLADLDPAQLHDDAFFDCEPIRPSVTDVARVLEHYRSVRAIGPNADARPEFHPLALRDACDPRMLAARIRDEDKGEKQRVELDALNERFGVQYW